MSRWNVVPASNSSRDVRRHSGVRLKLTEKTKSKTLTWGLDELNTTTVTWWTSPATPLRSTSSPSTQVSTHETPRPPSALVPRVTLETRDESTVPSSGTRSHVHVGWVGVEVRVLRDTRVPESFGDGNV